MNGRFRWQDVGGRRFEQMRAEWYILGGTSQALWFRFADSAEISRRWALSFVNETSGLESEIAGRRPDPVSRAVYHR